MDIRTLRYFIIVAHEGNFTKAAERLHITQPALSRQIGLLEEELGTLLFERGRQHLTLTDSGLLLFKRARDIVALMDKTVQEFAESREFLGGSISIGCVETMAASYLTECVDSFKESYPKVVFNIYTAFTDDIREKVDSGLIDIGILVEPAEIAKYDFMHLPVKDEWGVVINKSNPLSENSVITPSKLIGQKVIMPRRTLVQTEITGWFGLDSDKIEITATHNLLTNAVLLVKRNLGCAIGPKESYEYCKSDDLVWLPFEPPRSFGHVVIWKKNSSLSPTARKFLEILGQK